MYKKDEKLILLANKGKEGDKGFIEKGTIVTFVEAKDIGLSSFVIAMHDDILLVLPELAVKSSETDYLSVLRGFNSKLIDDNPELRRYHHSGIMRVLYKIRSMFGNLFKSKKVKVVPKSNHDLSRIKNDINKGWEIE
jgi:hypothetical protein